MNVRTKWLALALSLSVVFSLIGRSPQRGVTQRVSAAAGRPGGLAQGVGPLSGVERIVLPAIDPAALRERDRVERAKKALDDAPLRFAEAARISVTPANAGTSENLIDGTTVWRVRFAAPKARSLNLGFTRYRMVPGGRLSVYTPDYSGVLGPYTAADNEVHNQLWTPLLAGDEVVVEVSAPASEFAKIELELTSVNRGYTGFGLPQEQAPDSGSCNIDVICPEGDLWRPEIRSVAVYSEAGTLACTGALVNNTAHDLKAYFLTAFHCGVGAAEAPSVVTYWNYESMVCRTGLPSNGNDGGPLPATSLSGTIFRAGNSASDFTLLELDDPIPSAYNVHWAGWDNRDQATASAVGIHHPRTDEKRITFENNPTAIASYGGTSSPGDGTHVRIIDWDLGTTEPGSSGSPLFSPEHRIIGQLHGGGAACGNDLSDYYGRVFISWNGGGTPATRLKDWLDPTNSGAGVLDGSDAEPDFLLSSDPATRDICASANASYGISLASTLNYSDTVTLSASGQPAGTTATFNPNPVTPPAGSTLTIGNTAAAAAGSYTITVVGTGPTITHTKTLGLNVAAAAPAAPTAATPANGAADQPLRPTLTWTAGGGATAYLVEVAASASFATVAYSATVASTSHVVATDLEPGTIYFWRVRATNGCGTSAVTATRSFSTLATPGSCALGAAPTVYYSNNFEGDVSAWSHSGTGDTWSIDTAVAHSGANSFHAEDPAAVSDQRLVSPPITIPSGVTSPTLQFWNKQTLEDRTGGCYDGALVEVSTNAGTTWTPVPAGSLLTDPYNGPVNGTNNPLNTLQGWCGDPQDWLNSVINISAYAGQTVQFRFRLGSDTSVGRADGWHIDDVKVQSCNAAAPTADLSIAKTADAASYAPGDPITYTLTYVNGGPSLAADVIITDTLPLTILNPVFSSTGATITPIGGETFAWNVADLAVGQGGTVTIVGTVSPLIDEATTIVNTATISSSTADNTQSDNAATSSVDVAIVPPPGNKLFVPLLAK